MISVELNGMELTMDMQFSEIQSQENLTNQMRIAKRYGLCLRKNILDRLYHDRYQQYPQDLYHAIAKKKSIKLPKFWSKLPNSITYQKSFMMLDSFYLAMLMSYILSHFLRIQHIKEGMLIDLMNTIEYQRQEQVLYFCLNGGQDKHVPKLIYDMNCFLLKQILSSWYIAESPDLINDAEDKVNGDSKESFNDQNLNNNNNNLDLDLYKAYCEEFGILTALNTYKVSFFEHINYIVVKDDDEFLAKDNKANCRIKVRVGDVVELKEISDPDNISFVLVKVIIIHQANNGKVYAFFIFDWFDDLKKMHPILEYAQFRLQYANNFQWAHFHYLDVDY
ncbi:25396_t:CDS:2 [Racocetra persica]|uniref:25396_t:CDS:1 n=1 Tax=Racocetra persica TaxID=160502 RepID=A0ACA9Q307_9GLOM|nr:25396_t:CDS:2 [Racocetra persica]